MVSCGNCDGSYDLWWQSLLADLSEAGGPFSFLQATQAPQQHTGGCHYQQVLGAHLCILNFLFSSKARPSLS